MVLQVNKVTLIVNKSYGHNNDTLAKTMLVQLTAKLMKLKEKFTEAHLIGGDPSDAADYLMDILPARIPSGSRFKVISYLSEQLNVIDAW